jgi:serine/threonine protein kinase
MFPLIKRCVCKESGQSYAVKIIDVSQNHVNADGLDMVEQVHQEINILRSVRHRP